MKVKILFLALCLLLSKSALAQVNSGSISYSSNGAALEGYVAYDKTKSPQPAILIVHDWMGLSDFTKTKADQLAKEGYVAFAVDVYGKGIRPKNTDEAGKLATKYKANRPLLQQRMKAAYDKLLTLPQVDKNKIVVMGYCFGGTSALELARTGVVLAGTASFHGGLVNPTPENAKNIKGKVLIMHGADDPYVPATEVAAFKSEMNAAHINYKFVSYPGAVHAFTNPAAGNDNSKGAAYNAKADKASWKDFEAFLGKVF